MRNSDGKRNRRGLIIICVVLFTLASLPILSSAKPPTTSINIVNNSTWEIRHLYLSPVDNDNWGPDQINNSVIAPGASFDLSNVACDQGSIKVVTEDQDGCFLYKTVSCGASATWTITNDASPDCGN
jgi:hypothetical protein